MGRLVFCNLVALLACAGCSPAPSVDEIARSLQTTDSSAPIAVLVVTATHGYRHGPAIEATHRILQALNETTEFHFELTENLADLNDSTLARVDVLFFANSTLRLAPAEPAGLTQAQRKSISSFMDNGGGFAGAHSALDACYGWDEYRDLVGGGLFHSHPWTQSVRIRVEDGNHPATAHLGATFSLRDEIYLLDHNPRQNARVLLSLDNSSVDMSRRPVEIDHNDFPISWTLDHRGGRAFITKLGHFPEVWLDPVFIAHLLQGLRHAAGRSDTADQSHAADQSDSV